MLRDSKPGGLCRTASQALDDLMRKLLVVHRLPQAEERLAKREPRRNA